MPTQAPLPVGDRHTYHYRLYWWVTDIPTTGASTGDAVRNSENASQTAILSHEYNPDVERRYGLVAVRRIIICIPNSHFAPKSLLLFAIKYSIAFVVANLADDFFFLRNSRGGTQTADEADLLGTGGIGGYYRWYGWYGWLPSTNMVQVMRVVRMVICRVQVVRVFAIC